MTNLVVLVTSCQGWEVLEEAVVVTVGVGVAVVAAGRETAVLVETVTAATAASRSF